MSGLKKLLRAYFSFSKKELNGIFLLCILIFVITMVPYLYRFYSKEEVYDLKTFQGEAAEFKALAVKRSEQYKGYRENTGEAALKGDYFEFDPNGLAEKEWRRLGLSSKQVRVILNYEAKGGRFYRKADLKKIYSISAAQYASLEPYIRIAARNAETRSGKPESREKPAKIDLVPIAAFIELNSADSAKLESIRGIGPVFASRIIRYRNRLGGFYKKEQLREVYGLDSLKYSRLKDHVEVNTALIQKINLNKVTFEQLKMHPYLHYKQMNAILQYRKQHNSFGSVDDLKKLAIMNEEIIRKIEPYLEF